MTTNFELICTQCDTKVSAFSVELDNMFGWICINKKECALRQEEFVKNFFEMLSRTVADAIEVEWMLSI